jgi:hypothetical protein
MPKTITFDPKDFIGEPYRTCPKCGHETFGVLTISGTRWPRPRAHYFLALLLASCSSPRGYPLPPVLQLSIGSIFTVAERLRLLIIG